MAALLPREVCDGSLTFTTFKQSFYLFTNLWVITRQFLFFDELRDKGYNSSERERKLLFSRTRRTFMTSSTVSFEGVKQAVFFPFRGKKWGIKVLIGSALTFGSFIIPIVPLLPVFGYFGHIMKGIIIQEQDPEMPAWNDWGTLFLDGLKLLGAVIIYLLPALILGIGGYALFMALDLSMGFSAATLAQSSASTFPVVMVASIFGMFAGMAVMMLGIALAMVTIIILPSALGNMLAKGKFEAAFSFREWWPVLRANLSGFILAVVLAMGLFYLMYMLAIALFATIILCFLVPFAFALILFLSGATGFSMYAVAYRDGVRKMAVI
jgi:hypothetical protein